MVQNFPPANSSGSLRLTEYESGATSQYPINIYIFPSLDWTIKVVTDPRYVATAQTERIADRLMHGLHALITTCSNAATTTIAELRN